MKTITINNKEYTLEYTFEAAEHRDTVQKMFNIVSGAYIVKQAQTIGDDLTKVASAMIDGTSEMVADIPSIVKTCFYSGLLENHKVTEEESYELMKNYMKENKINFKKLFDEIKQCMEDDGFFELSGLMDMVQEMNASVEEQTQTEV
jgi:hypothetical protein